MLRFTYFENSLMISGDFNYSRTLQSSQLSPAQEKPKKRN
jgi:hypothetical protein